jgi:hypothetical protein
MDELDSEIEGGEAIAPDEAEKLSMGNIAEIEAQWAGVVATFRAGGSLGEQRDAGVRRELQSIAQLYLAVTGSSNDPEVWWRFLESKGIGRGQRRGKRLLFYKLIEHLSNEHLSPEEICSKSIISRRAAVLQHWYEAKRLEVPADQVADWILTNGGVKAVAAAANPSKSGTTKAEREAARDGAFRLLVQCTPLLSMKFNELPETVRPFADGSCRVAVIQVGKAESEDAAVDILGIADDGPASQRWLELNAKSIVDHSRAAPPGSKGDGDREDAESLLSELKGETVH